MVFISTFACESSTGFTPQNPGGLGCAPGGQNVEVSAVAAPVCRGPWQYQVLGEPLARTAGNMMPLGIFVASACSVLVGLS